MAETHSFRRPCRKRVGPTRRAGWRSMRSHTGHTPSHTSHAVRDDRIIHASWRLSQILWQPPEGDHTVGPPVLSPGVSYASMRSRALDDLLGQARRRRPRPGPNRTPGVSVARTACRSWAGATDVAVRGPEPRGVGVSTRRRARSCRPAAPNSSFVSARMIPARARSARHGCRSPASAPAGSAISAPTVFTTASNETFSLRPAGLRRRVRSARRVETRRPARRRAECRTRSGGSRPARSGEIATGDALDREHVELLHDEGPAGDLGGDVGADHVIRDRSAGRTTTGSFA